MVPGFTTAPVTSVMRCVPTTEVLSHPFLFGRSSGIRGDRSARARSHASCKREHAAFHRFGLDRRNRTDAPGGICRRSEPPGVRIPVSSANSGLTLVIGVSSFFDEKRTDTNNPPIIPTGAELEPTGAAPERLTAASRLCEPDRLSRLRQPPPATPGCQPDRPRSVRSVVTEVQRQHELPIPRPGLTSLPLRAGTGLWYTIPRWLRVARNIFLPAMRRELGGRMLPGIRRRDGAASRPRADNDASSNAEAGGERSKPLERSKHGNSP